MLYYTSVSPDPAVGSTTTIYYYLLNYQGDVVRLVNANGVEAARYSYDAWGNLLSSSGYMASTNPLRYRGYYYDTETGWYYLQSRYYDPGLGRFINADCYTSTGQDFIGCNMFVYALNNPIRCSDPTGSLAGIDDLIILAGAILLMAAFEVALVGIMNSPAVQEAENNLAIWVNNAFYDSLEIDTMLIVAPVVVTRVMFTARSIDAERTKAMARTEAIIKRQSNRYDYWLAEKNEVLDMYIPTKPLSFKQAVSLVRRGISVFASSRTTAYLLAKGAGFGKPISHGRHLGGTWYYFKHFHISYGGDSKGSAHIFYL